MSYDFNGKVALVTGGASGLGLAMAQQFAQAGAKTVIADLNESAGNTAVDEIRSLGGDALFIKANVTSSSSVEAMIKQTVSHYGRLDFACNNAGIEGTTRPIAEVSEDEWDLTVGIDLKGVWLCMKHEIPAMLAHGSGAIVNISSIMGMVASAGISPYVAAKHGVIGLTKSGALEYANQGLRINAICPGMIRTPMVEKVGQEMPEIIEHFEATTPQGRLGMPAEIADAVLWLCSDSASYVNGQSIAVDGAFTAQ